MLLLQEDARSHEGLEVEGREAAGLRQLPAIEVKNLPVPKEHKKKQVNRYYKSSIFRNHDGFVFSELRCF